MGCVAVVVVAVAVVVWTARKSCWGERGYSWYMCCRVLVVVLSSAAAAAVDAGVAVRAVVAAPAPPAVSAPAPLAVAAAAGVAAPDCVDAGVDVGV